MVRLFSALFAAFFAALTLSPADAKEASSNVVRTDHTTVALISASTSIGDTKTVSLGLHFKLKEGWKVYWRSPGDAGYPPSLDWKGSENLAASEILWPLPERFSVTGMETLGYKNEVVYPVTVTPQAPGREMKLRVNVDYLACSEICVPYQADLKLDLAAGDGAASSFAHLINRFAIRVPGDGAPLGLAVSRAELLGNAKQATVRITATSKQRFNAPDMFIEGPEELIIDKPKPLLTDGGKTVVMTAKVYGLEDLEGGLVGTPVTVTLVDGERVMEGMLSVTTGTAAITGNGMSLISILALAVLGGLILNLMPCVLPVLSIKLLSVVSHGGSDRREVRIGFLASSVGVVFGFWVLASALIALKFAGLSIGWGIQFQQPWFLIAMTVVVMLFAVNLWGVFEFRLPQWLNDMGDKASHAHGLGGKFLTGTFATLLATPCSAPFLGTAVGFALARNPIDIFAVFTALGVGLAMPYLLIAAFPGLATRLPKPGHWMITLRRVLGFALAATGVWLLSVLAAQVGQTVALVIGGLMVALVGVLYAGGRMGHLWHIGGSGVAIITLIALLTPSMLVDAGATTRSSAKDPEFLEIWKPFAPDTIPALIAEGKTVFVDVTADWCITCLVNKAVVLSNDEVLAKLKTGNVVAMQADWTLPDDTIADYLASFGRYGIPFNAVYGPGAPDGKALPELLSSSSVLDGLRLAAGDEALSGR
ncbi:MAG: disulfide bond formation protein DsbD [Rhodospirillaceae bacterium]|jgi:suppressor for copper-sensitivity B|nr:disulfide bond formation protein DsbD [Rhodospirillaceae bacterium]